MGFRENVPENEIIDFLNTIPLSNKLVEQAIIAYINNIGKSHKETLLSEKWDIPHLKIIQKHLQSQLLFIISQKIILYQIIL